MALQDDVKKLTDQILTLAASDEAGDDSTIATLTAKAAALTSQVAQLTTDKTLLQGQVAALTTQVASLMAQLNPGRKVLFDLDFRKAA